MFQPSYMCSKYRDPLHVILDYIVKVSDAIVLIIDYNLTWTMQREPHCDMALVHDDDLKRILEAGDGNVSKVQV
jgi:hypothetical protein